MVRRKLTCAGAKGCNVTNGAVDQKKKPDEKKLELIGERGCLEADRRTEKEKRKCHKDLPPARQREKKKKTEETKKKKWKKKKKSTKVGIHIPPPPTALEYKNTKKKDFLD